MRTITLPGTALATAGEDGSIKIWSRNGMLRSTLVQSDSPVYSVVWGADSDHLCYSTGSNIVIRSSQSSAKQTTWKAHEGVVLKVGGGWEWQEHHARLLQLAHACKRLAYSGHGMHCLLNTQVHICCSS